MANAKTLSTNRLINSITLRASLPITQVTFQEADFLTFINEEMDMGIVPHILSFHEDYLLFHEEIQLNTNQLSNGMYIVQINDGTRAINKQLVISK